MSDRTQISVDPNAVMSDQNPPVVHDRASAEERGPATAVAVIESEIARRTAGAWEARAREAERARAQVVRRIQAARRDVYDANLRAEQAQIERDQALRDRDAVVQSTVWRATWPLRAAGQRVPPGMRRVARVALTVLWWSITLKLPRKLRSRGSLRASCQPRSVADPSFTPALYILEAQPGTAAPIECRKTPSVRTEPALFVTHSPDKSLRPHVRGYLEALIREGIGVVLRSRHLRVRE